MAREDEGGENMLWENLSKFGQASDETNSIDTQPMDHWLNLVGKACSISRKGQASLRLFSQVV